MLKLLRLVSLLSLILIAGGGLESAWGQYVHLERKGKGFFSKEKLDLFFFKSKDFGLTILDEGKNPESPRYPSPAEALESEGCVAGVNGSFFTKDYEPLGLMIQKGKRMHAFESGSFTVAGVLYDTGAGIGLMRSRDFLNWITTRKPTIREALQGGPFLVERGKAVPALDTEKKALRTFVATNGKGLWCIGASSTLSLRALADWLASLSSSEMLKNDEDLAKLENINELRAFAIQNALNLDGGSSTLFWVKGEGVRYTPFKPVRNYVGVLPRPQKP